MVRYFINYEDLLENNVLGKKITLYSSSIFIKKKHKKGLVRFEPVTEYIGNNILNYVRKLNYDKKGLLMVELNDKEVKLFDELLIKKYEVVNENICKKIDINNKDIIKLIGFKSLINMDENEINKGNIVVLMPCISNNDYMYVCSDRSKLSLGYTLIERRNMLLKSSLGSDIYFHTKDEELIERYKSDLTEIKEVDFSTYKIINHKLFVLDSINNSDIIGFSGDNYYCLDLLSKDSTPIYIENLENGYNLSSKKNIEYNKKGYVINSLHLFKLLNNNSIKPLIKFINVYELEDGIYKRESLEKHLEYIKILKYTKKNW